MRSDIIFNYKIINTLNKNIISRQLYFNKINNEVLHILLKFFINNKKINISDLYTSKNTNFLFNYNLIKNIFFLSKNILSFRRNLIVEPLEVYDYSYGDLKIIKNITNEKKKVYWGFYKYLNINKDVLKLTNFINYKNILKFSFNENIKKNKLITYFLFNKELENLIDIFPILGFKLNLKNSNNNLNIDSIKKKINDYLKFYEVDLTGDFCDF